MRGRDNEEEGRRVCEECARLCSAVQDQDRQQGLGLVDSRLAELIRARAWQSETCAGPPSWLDTFENTCRLLADPDSTDSDAKPAGNRGDREAARLFVNDVIRDAYGPYVRQVVCNGRLDAGPCVRVLQAVGAWAAGYIADARRPQSKGMNKLANTVWTAMYDAFAGRAPADRNAAYRQMGAEGMGVLVETAGRCLEAMHAGGGAATTPTSVTSANMSRALKFLVSNFGRMLVLMGEGDGDGVLRNRTESWMLVREPVFQMWRCLGRYVDMDMGRDPFDGIGLMYKALALAFEQAVGDPVPWWVESAGNGGLGGEISPDIVRVLANVLINGSGRMSEVALETMSVAVRSLVGSLAAVRVVHAAVRGGEGGEGGGENCATEWVTGGDEDLNAEAAAGTSKNAGDDRFMDDVEAGILEFMSRCVDTSPGVFKRTLYFIMEYLLRPHPLVEELLCRVVMGVMEWGRAGGWEALQVDCMTMICDMLDKSVSCDEDLGLSPGVQQGVHVLAAAMLTARDDAMARVAEARFSGVAATTSSPASMPAGSSMTISTTTTTTTSTSTVDVYGAVRLAVYLRAMACSVSSGNAHLYANASVQQTLRGQLARICHVHAKRARGSDVGDVDVDVNLLLAWTAECLLHASRVVSLSVGPLSERQVANGATPLAETLCSAIEQLSGRVVLSAAPASPRLQRAAVLLDVAIRTMSSCLSPSLPSKRKTSVDGLDAALDAFDASLPAAGWLVGLAPTRTQRPTSRMRRVFGSALDVDATMPLQYLAMQSYKDYVSFSDGGVSDGAQALDVLPKSRIVGGGISAEFKARLTPYLVGLEYSSYSEHVDGAGEAGEYNRLMAHAKSLERAFNLHGGDGGVSKRVHRQVVASEAPNGVLDRLLAAQQALAQAINLAQAEGSLDEATFSSVCRIQSDLNTIFSNF